ncbi:TonB-dependent receptor plug domain-containing protein [Acidipila rosea]|uniref:Iron complex outermembrane receptor protein n=1 Tax=Acidipila rosea TaxID=768535 RepID=A0A4R1L3I4_9BACT|nr:TonB-dependent receptor [Acidipila rosea]TCK71590.1 iron complex outermembrane receptor protein [Acidipila rosea]
MKNILACLLPALLCSPGVSQQPTPADNQTVIVTATFEPVPLSENDRSVRVFHTDQQPLLFNDLESYLRLDPSVDLQERGPGGVQADISIRGTTFEQSLVLLNGLRINDPETGHLNMDIPVPLDAISRVEVLHGSGSTFYGSDALGGAVNLITTEPQRTAVQAGIGYGNYGSTEQHAVGAYLARHWSEQLSGSRETSSGFMIDRNYRTSAVSSETWLHTALGSTDVLLAASDRPYGANQFYGNFESFERTKGWFGSVRQQLGAKSEADFGYRRHTDVFTLLVYDPAVYQNNHIDTAWQGDLRRADRPGRNATVAYGLEASGDGINSSNLGQHARNQGAGYASLDLRALKRLSLSIGAREEIFSGGDAVFSPTAAAGYWLGHGMRLHAAAGHAFRLPTYTDLYYSDPTTVGNPGLRPESAWSYEGGLQWESGGRISFDLTGFRLLERNGIDYSKFALSDRWQATNVQNLNFTGAETTVHLRLPASQQVELGYTGLHASQQPVPGLISEYAFNYASQNATFAWSGEFAHRVDARTQVSIVQRVGQTAYPLWDLSVAGSGGRVRPYLRFSNLSNTGYEEVPGVPMPGRTIMGGAEFFWARNRR